MKIRFLKNGLLFCILSINSSYAVNVGSSIELDAILTDEFNNNTPGSPKTIFKKNTQDIYTIWQSMQLRPGQKVKYVCIAEDTHNVAPANTKVDEVVVEVPKAQELNEKYINGKFTQHKPNNGWPIGIYHIDLYVDGSLNKTLKFTIAEDSHSAASDNPISIEKQDLESWESIAIDTANHTKNTAFGIGSGDTREEAEKYAQQFCVHTGNGTNCNVVMTYQQCGAFAISEKNQGTGMGITKKIAEEQALASCRDADCAIVASDCNSQD